MVQIEGNIGKAVHFAMLIINNFKLRTRKYNFDLWSFFIHNNMGKAISKQAIFPSHLVST